MKITACILSYNVPESTDRLVENMKKVITKPNYDLVVFDNGSDPDKVSKYTTHRIEKNLRYVGGCNECLKISRENKSDFVWMMSNDIYFLSQEPLDVMLTKMIKNPKIGIIHPCIAKHSFSFFDWMKEEKKPADSSIKFVPLSDQICHFYRKEALDVLDWQYDSQFYYGWGNDWDVCFRIRKAGFKVAIDFDAIIFHEVSEVYKKGRDKAFKNVDTFYKAGMEEYRRILTKKYGPKFRELILKMD